MESNSIFQKIMDEAMIWEQEKDRNVFRLKLQGSNAHLTINNFPEEPMYTLYIDGQRIEDFDDAPSNWTLIFR